MLLLVLGCAPTHYQPQSYAVNVPDNVHTTRPLPCPYEERVLVEAEGWTAGQAMSGLTRWVRAGEVDAVVDVVVEPRVITVPMSQCESEEVVCSDYADGGGRAYIWRAEGLGVLWACPAPQEAPTKVVAPVPVPDLVDDSGEVVSGEKPKKKPPKTRPTGSVVDCKDVLDTLRKVDNDVEAALQVLGDAVPAEGTAGCLEANRLDPALIDWARGAGGP